MLRVQGAAGQIAGGTALVESLKVAGFNQTSLSDGLVYDASEAAPRNWSEAELQLCEVFELTQRAWAEQAPIVYIVGEAALHGHRGSLAGSVATGLLGGMRSLAVEGVKRGIPANAVSVDDPATDGEIAAAGVVWLLSHENATGQLIECGQTHIGRPRA